MATEKKKKLIKVEAYAWVDDNWSQQITQTMCISSEWVSLKYVIELLKWFIYQELSLLYRFELVVGFEISGLIEFSNFGDEFIEEGEVSKYI